MPAVAKKEDTMPTFLDMFGSMKIALYGFLVGLLIILIGGLLAGIGALLGINGLTLIGVGNGIGAVGRFVIGVLFILVGMVAKTDIIIKAGMLVAGALFL